MRFHSNSYIQDTRRWRRKCPSRTRRDRCDSMEWNGMFSVTGWVSVKEKQVTFHWVPVVTSASHRCFRRERESTLIALSPGAHLPLSLIAAKCVRRIRQSWVIKMMNTLTLECIYIYIFTLSLLLVFASIASGYSAPLSPLQWILHFSCVYLFLFSLNECFARFTFRYIPRDTRAHRGEGDALHVTWWKRSTSWQERDMNNINSMMAVGLSHCPVPVFVCAHTSGR